MDNEKELDDELDEETVKLMDLFSRFSAAMEEHSIEHSGVSIECFVSAISVMVDSFEHQCAIGTVRESLIQTLKHGPRMLFKEDESGELVMSGVKRAN